MRTVFIDSAPLGLLTHRGGPGDVEACKAMIRKLVGSGHEIVIPEICDYEVRRELMRVRATASVERLDALGSVFEFASITTIAMREAARLWAHARARGRPTADRHALDGDVILAAQAATFGSADVEIATTNMPHFDLLARAVDWTTL